MSDSGKALLLIAIVVCLVLMVQPDALASMMKRQPVPRRVLSKAEMQLFTTTSVTGEIVMVGAQGVLIDQGSQAVRVGTTGLSLMTGAAERMSIDSTGKVVLKPTSTTIHTGAVSSRPAFGTSVSASEIRSLTAPGADTGFLRLSAGGANTGSTAGSYIDIAGSGSGEMDKNIVFATAGVERLRVLNDGKVGVGTTVASSLLDIYSSSPELSIRTSGGATTGQSSSILLKNNSHTTASIVGIERANGYGGAWAGDLTFQTYYESGLAERMRITAVGRIGIGTTDPLGFVHIADHTGDWTNICLGLGNTASGMNRHANILAPDSYIPDGNTTGIFHNGTVLYLQSGALFHRTTGGNNGSGSIVIRARELRSRANSGSVTTGYEIGGDIYIDSGAIVMRTDGGVGPYTRPGCIYLRTGNRYQVNSAEAVDTQVIDWTTRMFIHGENGNVGIGTIAPIGKLDVWGTIFSGSAYHQYRAFMKSYVQLGVVGGAAFGMFNGTSELPVLYLTDSSLVGIGQTNPAAHLHITAPNSASVIGANYYARQIITTNVGTAGNFGGYIQGGTINGSYVYLSLGGYWSNSGVTSEVMRLIGDTGRVGIGTNSPRATLDVNGDIIANWGGRKIGVQYQGGDEYFLGMLTNDASRVLTLTAQTIDGQGTITFNTKNNQERMRITPDGYVGIGINNPYRPLMVSHFSQPWETPTMYFDIGTGNLLYRNAGVNNVSIAATGSIVAGGAIGAYSDERIKTNIRSTQYSISDLLNLQPVEYSYIDTIKNSTKNQIGFIAQQVKGVLPEVVNDDEKCYIPDVYRVEQVIQRNGKRILVNLSKEVSWIRGDKVQIMSREKSIEDCVVLEISQDQCLIELPTEEESISSEVFLYGKKVEDFHTIDYGKITALLVKCAQDQYNITASLLDRLSRVESILSQLVR